MLRWPVGCRLLRTSWRTRDRAGFRNASFRLCYPNRNSAFRPRSDSHGEADQLSTHLRRPRDGRPGLRALAVADHPRHSPAGADPAHLGRSEEHTSELQSQSNLVCRLLLEKKKEIIRVNSQAEKKWRLISSGEGRRDT